jgi:hypothetical protein
VNRPGARWLGARSAPPLSTSLGSYRRMFPVMWLLRSEDAQAVMLREIPVVLEVQRCERHFVGEAACCDPHVVDRAGPPAQARALAVCARRRAFKTYGRVACAAPGPATGLPFALGLLAAGAQHAGMSIRPLARRLSRPGVDRVAEQTFSVANGSWRFREKLV